ncbi:5-methylcytosine-specific restriction endonuclease system specificity protein McrC [Bernardetia sp. ABR2-2B]|uniref:5-methylcytosine-specific restriction endonuclease system specificity protein McrC n=1 Tax=Bernardetia sp. ABR2-2B TaxID=3127472 RepID=UPI0030D1C93A
MLIPIKNIYYLLCYAWNKLDESKQIKVDVEEKTELLDLFAKVLINATKVLLKRGIDRDYIENVQEINAVKGKLQVSQTLKQNLLVKQKTLCGFDDFSFNILQNQILLSTVQRLIKTKNLDRKLKTELIFLQRKLPKTIEKIELKSSLFSQIKIHRNNRFYGFVMNVCQIIYENTLPSENKNELGNYTFSDFTRDERKMNQLFEAFIRNFYKIEQTKFTTVKAEIIKWNFEKIENNLSDTTFLPQMKTDISLENETEKIIIDAKYYQNTMAINYKKEKIFSANLYQLFSYLLNQEDNSEKTTTAKGILLYPTIEKEYNLDYQFKKHQIQIKTLNLNADWREIEKRLKEIIETN